MKNPCCDRRRDAVGLHRGVASEKKAATVGVLLRAATCFDSQGVTSKPVVTDIGNVYRSQLWREACSALCLTPIWTRPYIPKMNGKAEQFILILPAEWANSMAF